MAMTNIYNTPTQSPNSISRTPYDNQHLLTSGSNLATTMTIVGPIQKRLQVTRCLVELAGKRESPEKI
ncbi:hypothetical protein Hanom_Chr07g00611201 [Helianthus anomalus]